MPDEIVARLRRFQTRFFPRFRREFRALVDDGQHPTALFIGCSDSRLVPYLLTGAGPGDLFMVRNVGNFVPPYDASAGDHGTAAAIEFAVVHLDVRDIIVCGHSHCGAVKALYGDADPRTPHINRWLDFGRDAVLPVRPTEEALRRTEQRSIALQLERLLGYPMVAERVEAGRIGLHGWHYVIEDGAISVLDVSSGEFREPEPPEHDAGDAAVHQLQ